MACKTCGSKNTVKASPNAPKVYTLDNGKKQITVSSGKTYTIGGNN